MPQIDLEQNAMAPVFVAPSPIRMAWQAHESGAGRVDESYSYALAINPGVLPAPCDALMFSEPATLAGRMLDGGTITVAVLPGYLYKFRLSSITSVSAGRCTALWHRKLV